MNKRGFELAWNTIVVMVLALMLLLFLVLFFTGNAQNFLDKIKGYLSYSNIDNIVQSCNVLADSGSSYNYCCEKIKVKYYIGGKKTESLFSCNELLNKTFANEKLKSINCKWAEC
jgi:hypothetical protein